MFASLDSKKVSYQVQNQVLLNEFNVHTLDKKTLEDVLIAENQVPAIDGSNTMISPVYMTRRNHNFNLKQFIEASPDLRFRVWYKDNFHYAAII